ncbi:MAG: TetR/AcrR family transcriptional regulator [Rhodobacteraceae bacterium]|nr:TetR/AcrR family transcriptional regulator [Paracoccaceae bacterium]
MSDMSQNNQTRDKYHHGNLPDALIHEGAGLLADVGIEGFSLRKLAARAGVTVAAPAHHFGNTKGLLTAIATRAFMRLAAQMQDAALSAPSRHDAVVAMCLAYFKMRTTDPGYAAVMFRLDLIHASDEHFRQSAFQAFGLLEKSLAEAVPNATGTAEISTAAKALWATTQGLTTLPMIEHRETEQLLRHTISAHVDALR